MEKRIITISREYGAGGQPVGHMIAEKLGIPFYDKKLVEHVAEESGFAPKFIEEHGEHSPSGSVFSYAFAPQGVPGVMNGLSTSDYLWNVQCNLHADIPSRVKRVLEANPNEKNPEGRIATRDKRRRLNYQHYTGRTWGLSQNYHICLDTSVLGFEQCAEIILNAVKNSK